MPFIGNQPALSYTSFAKQDFTTSATTTYTLDNPVANANELALFINNVRQEPTTAYSANSTTLTLTEATSASDDMYCVYLGKAVQTVNPPNASVGTSQLASSLDLSSKTVTLASNMTNAPAFEANLSSGQSINDGATDKVQFDTEVFDTDNCYDNSTNYRFTPTVAGKYYVYLRTTVDCTTGEAKNVASQIYKNGSSIAVAKINFDRGTANQEGEGGTPVCIAVVDMNGTSDYLEGFCFVDTNDGSASNIEGNSTIRHTNFGAYKLIGV